MKNINIESIMSKLQESIEFNTSNLDALVNFIALQLFKMNITDEHILDTIIKNIDGKYLTKTEIKQKIIHQLEKFEETNKKFSEEQELPNKKIDFQKQIKINSNENKILKELTLRLDRNANLETSIDRTLHFGNKHYGIISRIFNLQLTQNYLSALKYLILDDLVTKQSKFNFTLQESVESIINLINQNNEKIEIKLNDLNNYKDESQAKINDLNKQLQRRIPGKNQ